MAYTKSENVTDYVKIEMENGGEMVIELDEKSAPITVANFKKLVGQGFYDGLIFHRVISGFMIQGGDPQGTGMGGSDENIKGEFRINGVNNPISHKRGTISMARSQAPNSASSQFFICHADAKFLDGQYAAFGEVVSGIDTVDKIAACATNRNDRPVDEQKMKAVYFVENKEQKICLLNKNLAITENKQESQTTKPIGELNSKADRKLNYKIDKYKNDVS